MVGNESLRQAVQRFLEHDDSVLSANDLEAALLDEFGDDERVADLLVALAMYSPGAGRPYLEYPEVAAMVRKVIDAM